MVFIYEFVSHFRELRLIANHDPKMPASLSRTRSFVFEHGQELMFAQLLQSEDISVKCDRFVDIANIDRNMIAAVHLDTHL